VVSPFDIKPHPNVVHVRELKREGVIKAVTCGYEQSKGQYIIVMADDNRATPHWVTNMIAFMRPHDDEIFEGRFRHLLASGEQHESTVYGKLFACFFCIRRDKIARVGGLFDCCYKAFWADPDLSLRVWHNGGRVETCPNAWVYSANYDDEIHIASVSTYFDHDQEAFFQRWYHIYAQPGETRTSEACQGTRSVRLTPLLPPEECVKLYISIWSGDWETVKNILKSDTKDVCIFPESLPILYHYALMKLFSPRSPHKILYAVIKWLRKKGYAPSPFNAKFLKESLLTHERGWRAIIYFALRVIRLIGIIVLYPAMRFLDRS
jgi:glycosyltransferase involved in cell wall biosynthesis